MHKRIALLDEVRGLCLLLMVAYHAAYDWVYIAGRDFPLFHHPIFEVLQPLFAGVFILISGVCCNLSKSNLRRGAQALGLGVVLSVITWAVSPQQMVVFGILHLLGSCMLIYALLSPVLKKIPPLCGGVVFLVLFGLTFGLPRGWMGITPLNIDIPAGWYSLPLGFVVGLPSPDFRSSDYFPLLPWGLLFLTGGSLGRLLTSGADISPLRRVRVPILGWIGRHSLAVYLLHQPLLYGVAMLIR